MAKKARKKAGKKAAVKTKKKSPAKKRVVARKAKSAAKSAPSKKKRTAKGLGAKVAGAYRTVVDTFKGTDQLRNKMEQPGTSESE